MIPSGSDFRKVIYKRVWFSPKFVFLKFLHWVMVSIFLKKIDIGSRNTNFQKFENNRLSFAGSHKPGIAFYLEIIIIKI